MHLFRFTHIFLFDDVFYKFFLLLWLLQMAKKIHDIHAEKIGKKTKRLRVSVVLFKRT